MARNNRRLHLTVDGVMPCCSTNGRGFVVTYDLAQVTCSRCCFLLDRELPSLTSDAIITHTVAGNVEAGVLAKQLMQSRGAHEVARRAVRQCEAALERARADLDVIEGYDVLTD